jgi:hypothetical protein
MGSPTPTPWLVAHFCRTIAPSRPRVASVAFEPETQS